MIENINNKFCNDFLTATKKQLGFTFQKQVKDWKYPNVFYYAPRMQCAILEDGLNFDYFAQNYLNGNPSYNFPRTQLIHSATAFQDLSLDIEFSIFDGQNKSVIGYKLYNFRFGSLVPDKSIMYPYMKDGRRRFYGVLLPFNNLPVGKYHFQITEIYHVVTNVHSTVNYFTHHIVMPLTVAKNNYYTDFVNQDIYQDHNLERSFGVSRFAFYNKLLLLYSASAHRNNDMFSFDLNSRKIDLNDPKDIQTVFGKQSIYAGSGYVPGLIMLPDVDIVLNQFLGDDNRYHKACQQFLGKNKLSKQISNNLGSWLINNYNNSYWMKDITAAFTQSQLGNPLLDHNLRGNNYVCLDNQEKVNLIGKKIIDNRKYDFEELLPGIKI